MQCLAYGIFLKTEKCKCIVLLNACIFWQLRRYLVNDGLETTVLIQTWNLWIHWPCIGLHLGPFHQSSHENKWWLDSKSNPLERWDVLPCLQNIMNRHATERGWVAFQQLAWFNNLYRSRTDWDFTHKPWRRDFKMTCWSCGSFIHARYFFFFPPCLFGLGFVCLLVWVCLFFLILHEIYFGIVFHIYRKKQPHSSTWINF